MRYHFIIKQFGKPKYMSDSRQGEAEITDMDRKDAEKQAAYLLGKTMEPGYYQLLLRDQQDRVVDEEALIV